MSDDDSSPMDLARPEEEASRLKALAAEEYTSGNVEAALKHANRAHKLHPTLDGLPEMLGAFKILRTAAAPISETTSAAENPLIDYYEILGVKQFSHIDVIKKQYKKLAMTMHPDKNPSVASEEAFKLVGESARVLSDRIRRKEYDTRFRIALQSIASNASGLAAEETFRTACSTCQELHQFDRKYLGHNLMCPSCKKTFKAVEVEEAVSNGAALEKNESVGVGLGLGVVQTRESARLKERVARGESIGIVERCGLGMKRKVGQGAKGTPKVAISTDDDYLLKDLVPKILNKKVVKSGEEKGGEDEWIGEVGIENGLSRVGVNEVTGSGVAEVVESERTERVQSKEEGNMTLLQMKVLVKKKLDDTRVGMSGKEVDSEKIKAKKKNQKKRAREGDVKEKDREIENGDKTEEENEKSKQNEERVERGENHENTEDKEEGVGRENRREKENENKSTRKGKKKRRETLKDAEKDTDYEKGKKEEEIGSKKKRAVGKKNDKVTMDGKKKRGTLKEAERNTDYEKEKSEEELGSKKKTEVEKKNEKKVPTDGKKKRKQTLKEAERDTDYEEEKSEEEIGSKKKTEVEKKNEKKVPTDRKKKRKQTLKEAERDTDYEEEKSEEEIGSKKKAEVEKKNEKKVPTDGKKRRKQTLKEAERDTDYEEEKSEEEIGSKKKADVEKKNEKKVPKDGRKTRRRTLKEAERDTDYEKEKSEEEIGSKKKREMENGEVNKMDNTREKRVRRCVSRYGSLETLQNKTSNDHADTEIVPHAAKKQGNVEIMPVEASDFHDFDKDRTERSFKKGQVWAAYDDSDGMPRHYALIDELVSVYNFEVTLIWLQVDSSGQGESTRHISCGNFKTANKVSIKYLNLFSHVVDSARAARQVYRIYPKKGSVWALYNESASDTEGRNQIDKNKQSFDIVVCLSTYSNVHGLSIAHLEKVPGFKTVFKRRGIGANAVVCLGKDDVKQFSHQIPSKKLSSRENSDLPKDCWELDPASLPPEFLYES